MHDEIKIEEVSSVLADLPNPDERLEESKPRYQEDDELRLYCVMRGDLEAPVGKMMVQAGHAFVGCFSLLNELEAIAYMNSGVQAKIVLRVKNERELLRAETECKLVGIGSYLVTDAGRTVFPEPTTTCLGIGPVTRNQLPKYVQKLQLFP